MCTAGDAFRAGFAVGLVAGWPLQHSLQFAAAAGALAVSRKGALPSLPTLSEVVAHLQAHADQVAPELLQALGEARACGIVSSSPLQCQHCMITCTHPRHLGWSDLFCNPLLGEAHCDSLHLSLAHDFRVCHAAIMFCLLTQAAPRPVPQTQWVTKPAGRQPHRSLVPLLVPPAQPALHPTCPQTSPVPWYLRRASTPCKPGGTCCRVLLLPRG